MARGGSLSNQSGIEYTRTAEPPIHASDIRQSFCGRDSRIFRRQNGKHRPRLARLPSGTPHYFDKQRLGALLGESVSSSPARVPVAINDRALWRRWADPTFTIVQEDSEEKADTLREHWGDCAIASKLAAALASAKKKKKKPKNHLSPGRQARDFLRRLLSCRQDLRRHLAGGVFKAICGIRS